MKKKSFNVGLVVPTSATNALRQLATEMEKDFEDVFAKEVAMQISYHGGTSGIQRAHAPDRPVKILVIMEGTCPDVCVDIMLSWTVNTKK